MTLYSKVRSFFFNATLIKNPCYRWFFYSKWTQKNTASIFTSFYRNRYWGGRPGEFYSGSGSHEERLFMPYVNKIIEHLKSYGSTKPRIVDLGCGDFNVGRQLIPYCSQYIGVDIVKDLIRQHEMAHHPEHVSFCVLDMIKDELPDGDIALIRQVFQHLTNEHIIKILLKLKKYKVVFITEHHPTDSPKLIPNKNIRVGGFRCGANSGVYLDKPPFNIPASSLELILEVPCGDETLIRTYKLLP